VGVLLAAGGVTAIYETQKEARAANADSAPAGGAADMRIKWMVGKKYSMRLEFHQSTETPLPGQPQPMKSDVNFTLNFDVSALKTLDNGGRQLELQFVNDTLDVVQGGVNLMSFDSAQTAEAPQNPARAVIDTRLQYFTDAEGKVEKIEGMDGLMQRIAAIGKSQEQAVFKEIFSEDAVKKYVSFDDSMPNRKIPIGQSWEKKKDISGWDFGKVAADVKYTFKNWVQHVDHKCALIEVTGDFSTKSPSAASGALIAIKNGKLSGNSWFDPELGMIVDASNVQTMTVEVTTQAHTMTPRLTRRVRLMLLDVQ
jgi:hypothetical protein